MIMRHTIITSISSLLVLGISFISCSKGFVFFEENYNKEKIRAIIPASVESSKVVDADGSASFSTSEKVFVYNDATSVLDTDYLYPDTNGATTNLIGTLSGTYSKGDNLILLYNTTSEGIADYTHQDGSLETVVDAATASVKISSVDGNAFTTRTAYFENIQSVFKFTFKDGERPLKVKDVIVGSSNNKLIQQYDIIIDEVTYGSIRLSNNSALSTVYASLCFSNNPSDIIGFTVIDEDGIVYTGTKTAPAIGFKSGRIYSSTISVSKMHDGMLNRPFSVSAEKKVYFAWGNYKYKDRKYIISSLQYDNDYYYSSVPSASTIIEREIYYDNENCSTGWYILSRAEWNYLVMDREMNEGVERWYKVTSSEATGGVFGLLIPPDDALAWEVEGLSNLATGINIDTYTNLSYVFLPAGGLKHNGIKYKGEHGYYWAQSGGYGLFFNEKTDPHANSHISSTEVHELTRLVHD